MASSPFSPVTTTGVLRTELTDRIADSGALMIAVKLPMPNIPRLEMEKVPSLYSSGASRPSLALATRSLLSRATSVRVLFCTFLITGTTKPLSPATAVPTLMDL